MIFDTHMHTELSSDSEMTLASIIATKDELNIGVILTDHLDLNYYKEGQFRVDLDKFFSIYSPYRCNTLLLGVEVGLSSSVLLENEKTTQKYPFDFILGSVHSVNDEDIYSSYPHKGLSRTDYFNNYFQATIKYITEFSNFDSLAHIDYPCRYCNFENNNFSIKEHGEYLKEIFTVLINRNQALEINTRRLNIKDVYPATFELYKFYADCGGKYVTLGSDAHTDDAIASNFDIALNLCKELSLTPVYFKNRKMIEINDI